MYFCSIVLVFHGHKCLKMCTISESQWSLLPADVSQIAFYVHFRRIHRSLLSYKIHISLSYWIGSTWFILIHSLWSLFLLCFLLLFHVDSLTSNLSLPAELLTLAISGEVSGQAGEGSIGARATHATSVGPLANLASPIKTQNSPLLLTLDPLLTLLL